MQNRESSAMGTPMPFSNGDSYRFRLKKCNSSTKLTCPSCGQRHRFVPYYDTEEKITFPDYVGRCDREDNCGYHCPPPGSILKRILMQRMDCLMKDITFLLLTMLLGRNHLQHISLVS